MPVESLKELGVYKRHMTDGKGERKNIENYAELQRRAMLAGIDAGQPMATLRERLEETPHD